MYVSLTKDRCLVAYRTFVSSPLSFGIAFLECELLLFSLLESVRNYWFPSRFPSAAYVFALLSSERIHILQIGFPAWSSVGFDLSFSKSVGLPFSPSLSRAASLCTRSTSFMIPFVHPTIQAANYPAFNLPSLLRLSVTWIASATTLVRTPLTRCLNP